MRQWLKNITLEDKEIKIVASALKMAMIEGFYSAPEYVSQDELNSLLKKLNLPEDLEDTEWDEWEDG